MNNTQTSSAAIAVDKARTAAMFRRPGKAFETESPFWACPGNADYRRAAHHERWQGGGRGRRERRDFRSKAQIARAGLEALK